MSLTPHCDEHYEFIKDLMRQKYDEALRQKMYDFYESQGITVWLPGRMHEYTLEYIAEFESGYYKIFLSGSAPYFWRIKH